MSESQFPKDDVAVLVLAWLQARRLKDARQETAEAAIKARDTADSELANARQALIRATLDEKENDVHLIVAWDGDSRIVRVSKFGVGILEARFLALSEAKEEAGDD